MLTFDHAKAISELARAGAANGSPATPPAIMVKAWEAIHSFEAWVGEQAKAAEVAAVAEKAKTAATDEKLPEGPQG